eukprot:TRINITY_DN2877_c0_g3_i2.p1 TRINITY_DN2877_c0_g3~~TRINITY_DN2877_c0_g3_i2.p1  ORF type:complete len:1430 (+),score=200.58 TRINITY_DN2877_c0_g3_i2:55-4344(+)
MTSMRVASLLVSTLPTISADLFGFANSSEASIALEDRKLTSLTLAGQEGSDKVELKLRVSILGHLGPQDVTPSEADKKKAEKWIFAAALRSMLYSQDEGFPGPQLDTPPEIQHSVIQPMALNMGRRSPFQKTEFQISCRVRDEPSAIKLGTRFCQDYGDEAQILEIGTVRALDMADLYPREAYDFASKLGKGLPSFIHVSAAYFVNDKLSEGGLCYWESALDDALQLPLCPENSAPLEQSPWGCKCLPGYEGHVEFSHVEDFGGSFEIVGSCTAIREFCPLAGDVELKQKDDEGGAARGVVGEVALPSCKRGYQAEGETTCTEERKWVPDPQHLCHWTPPREQPEPYCERNMLNSTGVQIQGCGLCTISQGASCACAVKCGEDYERSGGGEEGKKECLRETFSCPHKLLFQADICVDEETKRPTHTFCCKEAWGENVPPVSLEIRNCGEISKDRDCLSSKHDGSGGVGNAGEPCCWQKRGRKCAPKSEHLEGATCAATKDAIVSAWSDLPTCNELPEPPPKPVCENVFASIPNLVYENCTDCTPDETCNCTVRCKPGTKQPTGKYAEGSEGIRKCEWRDVGVRAEFEPPPNCQGICETPDNQSGLLDVSLCKEDCVVGDKGCQCTVSCADGTVVFSGRPGKKSCMPTDKGQEYELSPTCRPVCVKPDSQFNLLEVIGCSGCIAGTDCPCRLECRGGNKALKGREGDKVCKLHQASATSMPTAEWADKLKADDEEAVSGVPQCLPPITISVVDAINQEALGGVTIKVYIASSNKEDRLLEVLVTSDSARDKSVMFYCEATSMSVRIEKDGYSSILRQLDRGSNCEDPSKCRFQFSLSKALPGNHLHPQGCFVKGKPRSIEWEMRAVLEWDNSPRDLDIWARNWGCYDAVERGASVSRGPPAASRLAGKVAGVPRIFEAVTCACCTSPSNAGRFSCSLAAGLSICVPAVHAVRRVGRRRHSFVGLLGGLGASSRRVWLSASLASRRASGGINTAGAAQPHSWTYFASHRDWCDHLLFYVDGSFSQGKLGGYGSWQLVSSSGQAYEQGMQLELYWQSACRHATGSTSSETLHAPPSEGTRIFTADGVSLECAGGETLPALIFDSGQSTSFQNSHAPSAAQDTSYVLNLPSIGFGTSFYPEEHFRGLPEEQLVSQAVEAALESGVRLFDCANQYTSQCHVGAALERAMQRGLVRREELVIVTKLASFDSQASVEAGLTRALSELRLSYVDVLMPHIPTPVEAWRWFEDEVDVGQARFLGVSNYDQLGDGAIPTFQQLLQAARIRPVVHEFELHPLLQNRDMVDFCRQEGIQILSYSPLGAPHKVEKYIQGIHGIVGPEEAELRRDQLSVIDHPAMRALANRRGISPALLALRWHLQQGFVPIPKSWNLEHVRANSPGPLASLEIDNAEMAVIEAMDADVRTIILYKKGTRGEL